MAVKAWDFYFWITKMSDFLPLEFSGAVLCFFCQGDWN